MKIHLFAFLAIFLSFPLNCSAVDTSLNCLNSNQNAKYNKGDTVVICIHFIPNNDESISLRMAYQITVDKYTAVQAKGAYLNFQSYSTLPSVSLIAQADNNGTNSENVTYLRKKTDVNSVDTVIPIFSLVVNIENGKITGTLWDNGCWDCTSLCYLDKINVNKTQSNCRISPCNSSNGTAACDPRIYISWIGTDANGNHMNSAGLRISRFRLFSVGEMYSSALNTYDNVLQSAQAGFNANIGDNLNNLFGGDTQITAIQFSKTSISNGQQIAYKYTKAGGNTAPGCTWSAISNVQSYAYVINHTNATSSYSHLLLKDIATSFTTIEDGILTVGTTLVNSFGVNGYTGPDASLTNQTYNFYVYGLSVATINSTEILQFYADLETYKVAVGSFSGYYSNTTTLLMI